MANETAWALKAPTEEDLRKVLDDPSLFASLRMILEREDRSWWIVWNNVDVIRAIRDAESWMSGASVAPPLKMVSLALRPGEDSDQGSAHRRKAFVRAFVVGSVIDTTNFKMMQVTDYKVAELLATIGLKAVSAEAKLQLDEVYGYLERSLRKCYPQQMVSDYLNRKADDYNALMRRASEECRLRESELMGDVMMTPAEGALADGIAEISEGVALLCRRAKKAPASAKAQDWVLKTWDYYSAHPEALAGGVERHRVYVRDVWAMVQNKGPEHGVDTLADYARIRRTALRGISRKADS